MRTSAFSIWVRYGWNCASSARGRPAVAWGRWGLGWLAGVAPRRSLGVGLLGLLRLVLVRCGGRDHGLCRLLSRSDARAPAAGGGLSLCCERAQGRVLVVRQSALRVLQQVGESARTRADLVVAVCKRSLGVVDPPQEPTLVVSIEVEARDE